MKVTSGNGRRDILWGVLFLAGALALILSKLGYLGEVRFWPVLFSIVLAVFFLDGIVKRRIGQMLFSVAFFIIVNDKALHLEAITPWTVLGAALLGTVGLHLLFPRFGKKHGGHGGLNIQSEERDGDVLCCENSFGSTVKYITWEISKVNLDNSFGGMEIYFSNAVLKNGSAEVVVNSSFGGVELYIPSSWRVETQIDGAFSDKTEVTGQSNPDGMNTLFIKGNISFGNLSIHYI
ncbi:MAG: cell wall-active antibiotics response protein [Roseburia sp.]|nr:cell wall-active antibiotics response protein [Roseburia sp.]